jgi:KAP family P-loop domain
VSSTRPCGEIPDLQYALLNDRPASGSDDCLDTREAASRLANILLASKQNSPFVLAVDGDWGVGKSSLLQQICEQLTSPEDSEQSGFSGKRRRRMPWLKVKQDEPDVKCVQFNAWTAENSSVLESLITTVLYQLDPNFVRRQAHRLARHKGLLSALQVSFSIVAGVFGLSRTVNDALASLAVSARSRMEVRDTIQNILRDWLADSDNSKPVPNAKNERSLIIFVDDLDRCSSDTVLQMCEVIKLYLDMPGLIFVLGCALSALARGVKSPDSGRRGQEYTYLEKIVQVAYRIPTPNDTQIERLIKKCAQESRTDELIDDETYRILAERTQRNPRRIKRIINSFILEYKLHPSWRQPELGIAKLIKVVLLYQLYPEFYEALVGADSSDDLIAIFLDYATVRDSSVDGDEWRNFAEKYNLPADKHDETIIQLKKELPDPLPELTTDRPLISLLTSLGGTDSCRTIRQQLLNNPLRSERGLNAIISALQAGTLVTQSSLEERLKLNALADQLQAQVMGTEGAAATEQAQYQELQLEADANNAAASSVAQAAQRKMQTNSKIFQSFDGIIRG